MARPARLGALCLPLLVLAACTQDRVPIGNVSLRQERKQPVHVLSVSLDRGQIAIARSEAAALEVEAEVRVREDRAEEFRGQELRFDDHVTMTEQGGQHLSFRSAHEGDPDGDDWELRITIRVPDDPEVKLDIDAGSAAVRLPAAKGVSANIGAGQVDVEIARIDGPTALSVDAGQIRVTAGERIRDVDLSVGAGQIDLRLPGSFGGSIDAATDVGDIDVAERFGLTPLREVVSQAARGIVGQGGDAKVLLRVDAGQITIR